ncbi:MAG: hypothetical protein J6W41_02935 [Alphaproteobacteria bacterium]|nr:hypothetical protein [Alphaproteobacteria bacterium]
MSKFLKEKWNNVRATKQAKKDAISEISVLSSTEYDDVCIQDVIQTELMQRNPDNTEIPLALRKYCKHFDEKRVCDNVDCPMHDKNEQYIATRLEYKRARGEFFNILFHGRKNYFDKR